MKCKHGYGNCSECGDQSEKENFPSDDKMIKFNKMCSEIMNYKPAWKNHTHFYITEEKDEILLSEWLPYTNVQHLVKVIDRVMADSDQVALDELIKNIIDTDVTTAFHKIVEWYHEKMPQKS